MIKSNYLFLLIIFVFSSVLPSGKHHKGFITRTKNSILRSPLTHLLAVVACTHGLSSITKNKAITDLINSLSKDGKMPHIVQPAFESVRPFLAPGVAYCAISFMPQGKNTQLGRLFGCALVAMHNMSVKKA